jgi:hypothetical protein
VPEVIGQAQTTETSASDYVIRDGREPMPLHAMSALMHRHLAQVAVEGVVQCLA